MQHKLYVFLTTSTVKASYIEISSPKTSFSKGKSCGDNVRHYLRLKPLFDSSFQFSFRDGYLRVTDFGFAKQVTYKTYTLCGTPEYIAPEVLLNKGHGKGVDWWCLGILIYEMLVGEPPFVAANDDPIRIYQQVLSGNVAFTRSFDKSAKILTKKLLTADLTRRLGCLKAGSVDIKRSIFFDDMDFDALLAKQLPAPIIPVIKDPTDTSNFDSYPPCVDDTTPPMFDGEDPFFQF